MGSDGLGAVEAAADGIEDAKRAAAAAWTASYALYAHDRRGSDLYARAAVALEGLADVYEDLLLYHAGSPDPADA